MGILAAGEKYYRQQPNNDSKKKKSYLHPDPILHPVQK